VVLCRCGLRYSSTVRFLGSPPAVVDHGTAVWCLLRVRAASRVRPADRADRPLWDRNREDARLNLKTRPRWIAGYYIPAQVPAPPVARVRPSRPRGYTILIPFSAVASHTQSQICWSEYHQTHGDGFAHVTRRDERVPRARRAPAEHALEVRPFSHDTEPL